MALVHEPLGKPGGPGLFGMKGAQLPAFIQHIRNDIMEEHGMAESHATAIAVSQCKKLAAKGNREAIAAVAEWERLKAQSHADNAGKASRAAAETPYGTKVDYGDPGYLDADGNQASKSGKPGVKRYPLSAGKVMAAWSYINQERNASQYTPAQLAAIKKKVRAAMDKHGHDVNAAPRPWPAPRRPRFSATTSSTTSGSCAPVTANRQAGSSRRMRQCSTSPPKSTTGRATTSR